MTVQAFPYQYRGSSQDPQNLSPLHSVRLYRDRRFGVDWESMPVPIHLGGVAVGESAKLLAVEGVVGIHPSTPSLFAWTT